MLLMHYANKAPLHVSCWIFIDISKKHKIQISRSDLILLSVLVFSYFVV